MQHIQMVNKVSSFKTKLTGNNAEVSSVNCKTLWCSTFPYRREQTCSHMLKEFKRHTLIGIKCTVNWFILTIITGKSAELFVQYT